MSELTLTESEVLTDNTDVICSTSIERIVTGRNASLAQIENCTSDIQSLETYRKDEWHLCQVKSGDVGCVVVHRYNQRARNH